MFTVDDELNYFVDPAIRPYSGPLYFSTSLTDSNDINNSGTFGLVDTGEKKLIITCDHVWQEFLNGRSRNSSLNIFLCVDSKPPIVFNPSGPIDRNEELDLVTFDIEQVLGSCDERRFYPLHHKPPPTIKIGDRLAVTAFPASLRCSLDGKVQFGRMPLGVNVTDLTPRRVIADVSRAKIVFYHEKNFDREPYPGISGSPCFLIRNHRPPYLVGFTSHFLLKNLSFTYARFIRADGRIAI